MAQCSSSEKETADMTVKAHGLELKPSLPCSFLGSDKLTFMPHGIFRVYTSL